MLNSLSNLFRFRTSLTVTEIVKFVSLFCRFGVVGTLNRRLIPGWDEELYNTTSVNLSIIRSSTFVTVLPWAQPNVHMMLAFEKIMVIKMAHN